MSEKLAEDWVALWQSELTAMAADRELREFWAAMVALWGQTATAALGQMRNRHEFASGSPLALEPPRPPAAVAASEPGVDEIRELNRRIAELERRLADFQRDQGA